MPVPRQPAASSTPILVIEGLTKRYDIAGDGSSPRTAT